MPFENYIVKKWASQLPVQIQINGVPLDTLKNYYVATSDYLANGGNKMSFLKDALYRNDLDIKI